MKKDFIAIAKASVSFILVLSMVLFSLPPLTAQGNGSVDLSLSPATKIVTVGETFSLDIQVSAGDQEVDTIDSFISFDADYLEVVNLTHNPATFDVELGNEYDNTSGEIKFSAGALGNPLATGTFTIATVELQAKAGTPTGTPTELVFTREDPYLTDAFLAGDSVLGILSPASITIVAVDLSLQPSTTTSALGKPFDINIQASVEGEGVDTIDAFIQFGTEYLEVTGVTVPETSPFDITLGEPVPGTPEWLDVTNESGIIKFSPGVWSEAEPASGDFTIATINFTAKSATEATLLTFIQEDPWITDAFLAGESILRNLTGASVTITSVPDSQPPVDYGCSEPVDGATGVSVNPTLVSSVATDATPPIYYKFRLATNEGFTEGVQESDWQTETSWTPATTLAYATDYWWQVKAKDSATPVNEGDWSSPAFKFTTQGVPDTEPPTITMTDIPDFVNKLDKINGTASDNIALDRIEVLIENITDSTYWNGTDWIADETWLVATGTTEWSYDMPTLTDSEYEVRAKSFDKAGNMSDVVSDSFTFDSTNPSVTVISPNGGEFWAGGSTQEITWTATDTNMADNPITIEYFNGSDWVQIATDEANDGSYDWEVPEIDTSDTKVRVTAVDKAGNSGSDESDAEFTIDSTNPSVTVISPNGGEFWAGGSTQGITWTATDTNMADNPITIEYYDGTDWVQIATDEANDGSYTWTVPMLDISTAKVRVTAVDKAGNSGSDESDDMFTIDSTPPEISGISISKVATTATILWETDELATSQVFYDTESHEDVADYANSSPLDKGAVTDHRVLLSGLTPGATYYFRVKSDDRAGNPATSPEYSFTIKAADTTPPLIAGITVTNVTTTTATIFWNTNELSTSQVEYGLTNAYGKSTPLDTIMVLGHSVSLSGLSPETEYYFLVKSKDASGNEAVSGDKTFTTLGDTTPPVIISGPAATAITDTRATIFWITDELSTSQVKYGTTEGVYDKQTPLNETLTIAHGVVLAGLSPETTYYFKVISKDASGNEATAEGSFKTEVDETPPVISEVTASVTATSVVISWLTNEPADSQVEYKLTTETEYSSTPLNSFLVTEHSMAISGLSPDTTYDFRVKSADEKGNPATPVEDIFKTSADTTPPLISGIVKTNITATSAIILWLTNERATSQVDYGLTESYELGSVSDDTLVTSHGIILTDLTPGKTCHFRVVSQDASDNQAFSTDDTFTTEDTTPPAISYITVVLVTDTEAIICWTTDEPATSKIVYDTEFHESAAGYEFSSEDTTLVTSHGMVLSGLNSGVEYHFRVIAQDASGNEAISGDNTFTTIG